MHNYAIPFPDEKLKWEVVFNAKKGPETGAFRYLQYSRSSQRLQRCLHRSQSIGDIIHAGGADR